MEWSTVAATDEQEAELAELAKELTDALPKMRAAFESSCETLEALHRENEEFFSARGIA